MEFTPDKINSLKPNEVFVFGSNLKGHHKGGAARVALDKFGAVWGKGVGIQGQSYAIPTMQGGVETIKPYVDDFIVFADKHPDLKFYVTRIGCGIAGFQAEEIAPLFSEAMGKPNIVLPFDFVEIIKGMPKENFSSEVTWNSETDFLDEYRSLKDTIKRDPDAYLKIKELRGKEFRNTVDIVNQGWYMTENGVKVSLGDDKDMRENSKFYSSELIAHFAKTYDGATKVDVINEDCLAVAAEMVAEGYNPAVLNMASRRNPGGGVVSGAGAQEETIFRRTNLFRSLYQYASYASQYGLTKSRCQYPLHRDFGGVYTPGATLFRTDEASGYKLMEHPVKLSFISVAALNKPELIKGGTAIAPQLIHAVKNKIRTILSIGMEHGHDSLVLGAFGCGAFKNPPKHIAYLFHEVLNEKEFQSKFRRIVFAIIDDHNSRQSHNPEGNLKPFKDVFCDNIIEDPGYKVKSYSDYVNSPDFDMSGSKCLHREMFGHDYLRWSLYSNGVLEISGHGEIPDYVNHWVSYFGNDQAPWVGCDKYGVMPTRLIVREGVTRIGDNAFESFGCLRKVLLPNSLESMGKESFFDCFNIEMINIPNKISLEDFSTAQLPMYYQNRYEIVDKIMKSIQY